MVTTCTSLVEDPAELGETSPPELMRAGFQDEERVRMCQAEVSCQRSMRRNNSLG